MEVRKIAVEAEESPKHERIAVHHGHPARPNGTSVKTVVPCHSNNQSEKEVLQHWTEQLKSRSSRYSLQMNTNSRH